MVVMEMQDGRESPFFGDWMGDGDLLERMATDRRTRYE